jgi:hypothetical protein
MWLFTNQGFISIVQHRDDPELMIVRARRAEHLQALLPDAEVLRLDRADYRYRVFVSRLDLETHMLDWIQAVDYDNFKDSIPDHEYHDAAMGVWNVMYRLQPGQPPAHDGQPDLLGPLEGDPF